MSDMKTALLEVIATKMLQNGAFGDLPMPDGLGQIRWTGWKSSWEHIEPHAQLIWFLPRVPMNDGRAAYVDMPSMNHGVLKLGDPLNVAYVQDQSHHLHEKTTPEELREWFKEAMILLIDDVLNEFPNLLQVPNR